MLRLSASENACAKTSENRRALGYASEAKRGVNFRLYASQILHTLSGWRNLLVYPINSNSIPSVAQLPGLEGQKIRAFLLWPRLCANTLHQMIMGKSARGRRLELSRNGPLLEASSLLLPHKFVTMLLQESLQWWTIAVRATRK